MSDQNLREEGSAKQESLQEVTSSSSKDVNEFLGENFEGSEFDYQVSGRSVLEPEVEEELEIDAFDPAVESENEAEEDDLEDEEIDYDLLALQSPPSTTFSQLAGNRNAKPLRDKPAYRHVVRYVKTLLEELVSRNTENVLSHFGEWSTRVIKGLKNTYGVPLENFLPTSLSYVSTLKSFTFDWKDAIEEYMHEYGAEILGEDEILEKMRIEIEEEGENGLRTVNDVVLKEDDWDEGGYKHYLDRKAEPKDPPFDEFEYVTLEQMSFFDEVGVGLPKHEQFEIHMAMLRLAKVRKLPQVRFWGKIFGLYQDYFVAEAVMKPEDMKVDDFDDLPEYEESEFVGEFCEELLIEELSEQVQTQIELEPEEIGELVGEEYGEEHEIGETYGEFYTEYEGEDSLLKPHPDLGHTPTVTFDDVEVVDPTAAQQDYEMEIEGEIAGEEESIFELEVDDGRFKEKMNLKNYKLPQLPMIKEKPIKLPPMEDPGEGINKFVFFVTNDPKSDWIRLPHVTPEQIVVARQIRKFFTGYLTSRVNSYPKFPGIEMNLLRAQIARISAGTQVSPAGYFRFDEGEEAADAFDIAAGQGGEIALNKDFEPLSVKDLTDPTCTFWVHHTAHILNQGRTVWFNVNQKGPRGTMEGIENEEGEEAPPFQDVVGEKGPPLLTSCAEDLFMEAIPPWTVKPAIELAPNEGCVYVRSNLWPGAYNFAFGRKIGFMYHGWGAKAVSYGYTPPPPYSQMKEYPLGPGIIEITDPTPYQEEEYRLKLAEWLRQREKHPMPMMEGEGGEDIDEEDD